VQLYPAPIRLVRQVYQELRGVSISVPDPTIYPRWVTVLVDPRPSVTFGQTVDIGSVEKRGDTWHQPWVVVDPTPERAAAIRDELKDLANSVAASKRQELTTAHLLTFMELDRLAADATPTAAEYPLIAAIALGRSDGGTPTTFAQAATAASNFRSNWTTRAAQVERKYHEVLGRIDAASTLAQAKAILAELESIA
jgi:hypothetical protein